MTLTRGRILGLTTIFWATFLGLSWPRDNRLEILNIVGFASLCVIPGLLTVLAMKLRRPLPFWHRFGQIIGWSVLELMVWGLLGNTFLPFMHVPRPLDPHPMVLGLAVLYIILAIWSWPALKGFRYAVRWSDLRGGGRDVAAAVTGVALVVLTVLGANSLNNNGSDIIALVMLIGIALFVIWLLRWREVLREHTYGWAIYAIGLSLLLMTSLRGWYVTGHDIQHEYEVFQLAKNAGHWDVASLRDPYNACMSITILPTIFANVLRLADPYVYKVLFQLLFATVPVLIFALMRRYLTKAKALLAALYFMAFPTYFTDMPFLNRQEIAFLFLALMLLVIFDWRIAYFRRRWLFIAFGFGMVLSHYSTTYSVLLILLLVVCLQPVYDWTLRRVHHWRILRRSSLELPDLRRHISSPVISLATVAMMLYIGIVWNGVLTQTASAATDVITQTVGTITDGFKADFRSSDVSYSLLSPGGLSPQQDVITYAKLVVQPLRASQPPGSFYLLPAARDRPKALPLASAPLTALGRLLSRHGLGVSGFNYGLKQSAAKLLQVFVLLGLVYAVFSRRFSKTIEPEYMLLTIASLIFVALQVALPDLSTAYGLLRAFQQSLMLLGLFLVVGTFALSSLLRHRKLVNYLPAALAIVFFLASTGVISQLLGGYQSQLQLNNAGQYYDVYYTHPQELAAAAWLNHLANNSKNPDAIPLQAESFAFGKLVSYTPLRPYSDIYPGLIQPGSYVYLGYTNVTKRQSSVFYNGDLVTYAYPTSLLNQQKNLIYSNGGAAVYK